MAHPLADLFARQRDDFVDHYLRHPAETVLPIRIERNAKQRCVDNRAGQRQERNTGVSIIEEIRLDDQGWPRFPIVPRRRNRYNVATLQVQPSTDPAAMLRKSSNCADRSDALASRD